MLSSTQPETKKEKLYINAKGKKTAKVSVETFSTTISSSKMRKTGSPQTTHHKKPKAETEAASPAKNQTKTLERSPSMQVPLRSNDIIRNIQTVKREKRYKGKFIKIKS